MSDIKNNVRVALIDLSRHVKASASYRHLVRDMECVDLAAELLADCTVHPPIDLTDEQIIAHLRKHAYHEGTRPVDLCFLPDDLIEGIRTLFRASHELRSMG